MHVAHAGNKFWTINFDLILAMISKVSDRNNQKSCHTHRNVEIADSDNGREYNMSY